MAIVIFHNARIFDGWNGECAEGMHVVVEGDRIVDIAAQPPKHPDARNIECSGHTLMPGMIDAHVHVYAAGLDIARAERLGASYVAHYARNFLAHALDCGFTSVRDMGGADPGLSHALRDGLLPGPRLFFGGPALSQTAGHGDFRPAEAAGAPVACACQAATGHGLGTLIVDGPEQVRQAVRDALRRGASHIKLMGSGGVTSPADPIHRCQFSDEEIRMAVAEAERWGAYVAAHCHPDEAIRRCLDLGVRSIEHGTLISRESADLARAKGAFVVPTLSVIQALIDSGAAIGLPRESVSKLESVAGHAAESLQTLYKAGANVGFGTDLLGPLYRQRDLEITLRSRVLAPLDILRSACAVNAALLRQEGQLGCVRIGARADLLLVDGNPLDDIGLLTGGGKSLLAIMVNGRLHKQP